MVARHLIALGVVMQLRFDSFPRGYKGIHLLLKCYAVCWLDIRVGCNSLYKEYQTWPDSSNVETGVTVKLYLCWDVSLPWSVLPILATYKKKNFYFGTYDPSVLMFLTPNHQFHTVLILVITLVTMSCINHCLAFVQTTSTGGNFVLLFTYFMITLSWLLHFMIIIVTSDNCVLRSTCFTSYL